MDKLTKYAIQLVEEVLEKGPNYWKDKNPAKYKKMLGKLKGERKKPGSKERGYQQVLQAKRREKGGAGVKAGKDGTGHSKGHMKTKTSSAVSRYQSSEKKAGTKLSIDRKDNSKGYAAGNTRNIPQKLNRGRHHADPKKLANWRKGMKKSDLTIEEFKTMLMAKAIQNANEQLAKALEGSITDEQLFELICTGELSKSDGAAEQRDWIIEDRNQGNLWCLAVVKKDDKWSLLEWVCFFGITSNKLKEMVDMGYHTMLQAQTDTPSYEYIISKHDFTRNKIESSRYWLGLVGDKKNWTQSKISFEPGEILIDLEEFEKEVNKLAPVEIWGESDTAS